MRNELLDILSGKTTAITNEQLINYLTGKLSDSEKHELEKSMISSGIDNDAIEGLQMVANKDHLHQYEHDLNRMLREKLHSKKVRRKSLKLNSINNLLILTGALLVFILLIWVIFHLMQTP